MKEILIVTKNTNNDFEIKRLVDSFRSKNIEVSVCHPDDFDLIVDHNLKQTIKYQGKNFKMPKVVLCRIGASIKRFQLAVLRQFEQEGIPCINPSQTIGIVKDKLKHGQVLFENNIPIPKTMMVRGELNENLIEENIGFPCVIKLLSSSYGEGVYLCKHKKDYRKLIEKIRNDTSCKTLLVQEYVGTRPGQDVRVFVVGGKVLGAMLRTAPEGDFRANITLGGTGAPYQIDAHLEFLALETCRVLELDIAGIDLLFTDNGYVICEANSNPGFQGFETFCEVDIADQITEYVNFKLQS